MYISIAKQDMVVLLAHHEWMEGYSAGESIRRARYFLNAVEEVFEATNQSAKRSEGDEPEARA